MESPLLTLKLPDGPLVDVPLLIPIAPVLNESVDKIETIPDADPCPLVILISPPVCSEATFPAFIARSPLVRVDCPITILIDPLDARTVDPVLILILPDFNPFALLTVIAPLVVLDSVDMMIWPDATVDESVFKAMFPPACSLAPACSIMFAPVNPSVLPVFTAISDVRCPSEILTCISPDPVVVAIPVCIKR